MVRKLITNHYYVKANPFITLRMFALCILTSDFSTSTKIQFLVEQFITIPLSLPALRSPSKISLFSVPRSTDVFKIVFKFSQTQIL